MSSSKARIKLAAPAESTELVVVDSEFNTVGYGVGELEAAVDPGVYQLEYRAGRAVETKLVALGARGVHEELNVHVGMSSPAPIERTSTSREPHQSAAREHSERLIGADAEAGLLILVRSVTGSGELPLDCEAIGGAAVVDAGGEPVAEADAWEFDEAHQWAACTAPLPSGGYALRTAPGESDEIQLEQSVWLSEGWQTLVYVPNTASGPAFDAASIHMAPLHAGWTPWEETEVSLALEAALCGLRDGRSVVHGRLLDLLFAAKFTNPMLGIVGAHALFVRPHPDLERLGRVVEALEDLVPGHPDVTVLPWMLEEAAAAAEVRAPQPPALPSAVDWPPMLRAGYAALVRLDALSPGAIRDRSGAEGIAAGLVPRGIWTTWRARAPERVRYDSPVTDRVAEYLTQVSMEREIEDQVALHEAQPSQIAVATELPSASVARALEALEKAHGG